MMLQGVVSLVGGLLTAFVYGWNMAIAGVLTVAVLVGIEGGMAQYLKLRGERDRDCATEASRVRRFYVTQ